MKKAETSGPDGGGKAFESWMIFKGKPVALPMSSRVRTRGGAR